MSTSKVSKSYTLYSVKPAIRRLVSAKNLRQIDRLAEWLRRKRVETGYSFPEIARRSGGLVSQGTAANVANKRYDAVDEKTVRGLAKVFEVTELALWDIVNGVTPLEDKPSYETREVKLRSELWRLIDDEAQRTHRTWISLVEAMFGAYFGGDPNIHLERLQKIRRDAVIIPLNAGGEGELPFTKETDQTAKRRSAKPLAKRK